MTLLGHPTISGYAFSFFSCVYIEEQPGTFDPGTNRTVNRTGSYYMTRDYSLKCYDTQWWLVSILPIAVIILFSLGAPAMFALTLWRNRETLDDPETEKQLGVLYRPYRRDVYWYEPLQMVFKLGLWVALCFFSDGSQLQLVTALAMTIVQVTVHARLLPYSSDAKNFLQTIGLFLTAAVSFSGMTLNYLLVAQSEARLLLDNERVASLQIQIDVFEIVSQVIVFGGILVIAVTVGPKMVREAPANIAWVGKLVRCRCRKMEHIAAAQAAARRKAARDRGSGRGSIEMMFWDPNPLVDAEEAKKKEDAGSGGGIGGGDGPMTGAPQQPQLPQQPQPQQVEAKPGRPSRRTMLGRIGGRSKMVSSRHVGGVKKNPLAGTEGGGSGMAAGRDDDEYSGEDHGGAAGGGGTAIAEGVAKTSGAASATKAAKSKSSVSPSVPHIESPWQRMKGNGKSDGSGDGTAVGGGGDDIISEGVESKRPDLMIALDDNRLNRASSVNFDSGCDDGSDGEGDVNEVADLTLVLDGDSTHDGEEKNDGEMPSSTTSESRLNRLRRLTTPEL